MSRFVATTLTHLSLIVLTSSLSISAFAQENSEWLVEMDPSTGTFAPVGPSLENVFLVYVDLQCRDEENGQYIFLQAAPSLSFITADINTAEVVDTTLYPTGYPLSNWGFHCYGNCDSLIIVYNDPNMDAHLVNFFNRLNGTDFTIIGEPLPDDNPSQIGSSFIYNDFDRINNLLYLYSNYSGVLNIMSIPSGDIIETYETIPNLGHLTFDEVNNELYALEQTSASNFQLYRFDTSLENFQEIGDEFSTNSHGHTTSTIDGNNERLILTRSSYQGSFVTSIDLNSGVLLADEQTMPGYEFGGFGGPNTINGQYYNSTNQLITLHWGTGSHLSITDVHNNHIKSNISPNPNTGDFRIINEKYKGEQLNLLVTSSKGQEVGVSSNIDEGRLIHLNLKPGYYIANIEFTDSQIIERIPFIVIGD
jgi:hypothetical protein